MFSISNKLIFISALFTFATYFFPNLYSFGLNTYYLDQGLYYIYIIQFFTGTFLHGSIIHLLANSIFIYFFWNVLEWLIWKKKFFIFFIFVVFFNGILITNLSWVNTIGISWFVMALLSYYTLELKSRNNPEYKWWITAIILNIAVWLMPWVSFLWHLLWAIAWVLYYLYNKDFFRKKYVWESV